MLKYQILWISFRWGPSCSTRTDGQTVGHDEANGRFFRSFANVLKNESGCIRFDSLNFPVNYRKIFSSRTWRSLDWHRLGVAQRVGRGIALLFHDRGTRRGWVVSSMSRPHFTPGKDLVPILQEAGWAPGPVCTGRKSCPHRDSIPDRPARSSVAIPTELPGPRLWH